MPRPYVNANMLEKWLMNKSHKQSPPTKLWNRNFFLLWQGQFVSVFGTSAYFIALGFYILELTGSTAIMGTYYAIVTIPSVILSPFAGVLVDRWNRKTVIVWTDMIRGVTILALGIGVYYGVAEMWHFYLIGTIAGICGAFFRPAIMSAIPDIVPEDKLTNANAANNSTQTLASIFGRSIGGAIYAFMGASLLFIFDGVSYIFSGITEMFITIPQVKHDEKKVRFKEDFLSGLRFLKNEVGLLHLFLFFFIVNVAASIRFILLLPLFERSSELGPMAYGLVMASVAAGALLVSIFLTKVDLPRKYWFPSLFLGVATESTIMVVVFFLNNVPLMMFLMVLRGISFGFVMNILPTTIQSVTPKEMRGKIFGLMGSISGALLPLSYAFGGILADLYSLQLLAVITYVAIMFFVFILYFNKPIKKLFNNEVKDDLSTEEI